MVDPHSNLTEKSFRSIELDRLASDKQAYAVLSWLSSLSDDLSTIIDSTDSQITEDYQQFVTQQLNQLLEFIEASFKSKNSDKPFASKALRHSVGAIYEKLYSSDDHIKGLYETANGLLDILTSSGKNERPAEIKHYAAVCIGCIFKSAGSKIVSIAPLAAMTILKNVKSNNSSSSGYRLSLLKTLSYISLAVGDTFEDNLAKDIWKACRSFAQDRSAGVSAAAFDVMHGLIVNKLMFKTGSDFESFTKTIVKAFESPYKETRQAAARCFAHLLKQLATLSLTKKEAMLSATRTHSKNNMFALRRSNTGPLSKKKSKKSDNSSSNDDDDGDAANDSSRSQNSNSSSANGSSNNSNGNGSSAKQLAFYTLSFVDGIKVLCSIYTSNSATARAKVGVIETLSYYFTYHHDANVLEKKFFEVASVLLGEIVDHPSIIEHTYKADLARKHVRFLLFDMIAVQSLGEYGQLSSAKLLTNEVLAKPDSWGPNSIVLSLTCVNDFISMLGPAVSPISGSINDALSNLIGHTNKSVRIHAAQCSKSLILALPSLLSPALHSSFSQLQKALSTLSTAKVVKDENRDITLGYSYLTALIISIIPSNPQYFDVDLVNKIYVTATGLLKANGNVGSVSTQVQTGWTLLSGVMTLGPNFVKINLSQLFLLWKSHLQNVARDQRISGKGALEIKYMFHTRYCALVGLVSFLEHNTKLLTQDVSKRISSMLQGVIEFISSVPAKKLSEQESSNLIDKDLSLNDYLLLVQQKLLQSFILLLKHRSKDRDIFPANILGLAIAAIADPDKFISSSATLSTTIAASNGVIDNIWESADNHAYGLTSKIREFDLDGEPECHWMMELSAIDNLEKDLRIPFVTSLVYEPHCLMLSSTTGYSAPVPLATGVVDLSIDLFSSLLPIQTQKVQEGILDELWSFITSSSAKSQQISTQKRNLRGTAILANVIAAVHGALKNSPPESQFKHPRTYKSFMQIIKNVINHTDPYIRNIAAQCMGLLCAVGGSASTGENIKYLIDEIVKTPDPNLRAGSSLSLGYIMKYVGGGVFGGLHLKTVLGILMSLANDPHAIVHFWALESISIVIGNSGLGFSSYASSTLYGLLKLYILETHGSESSSVTSNNLNCLWPTPTIIARCVGALINILGPDLQESSKSQQYVMAFVRQFSDADANEGEYQITIAYLKMVQELAIFCPQNVNFKRFGTIIYKSLILKDNELLKSVAIEAANQLIRTRPDDVFNLLGHSSSFEKQIWILHDQATKEDKEELSKFLFSWLEQTYLTDAESWITRVQDVLSKPRSFFYVSDSLNDKAKEAAAAAQTDSMVDEESMSISGATEASDSGSSGDGMEPVGWQTKELAVSLLFKFVQDSLRGQKVALDIDDAAGSSAVVKYIGDIIKIAFSASISSVLPLRLLGLQLLDVLITELKDLRDPDFEEVALLEQYQAQISSALTPAFAKNSDPHLVICAVKVSATFIGSGIIKSADRMGRILKLLIDALKGCGDGPKFTLGEFETPGPDSQVTLKVAVLALWAKLQVETLNDDKEYLIDIVNPHIPVLIPLWISTLRDYAKLKFDPEQSSTLTGSLDQMYSAFSSATILPVYEQSWLQLVDAISCLIEKDRALVFETLDEKEREMESDQHEISYSNEPAAFFFVFFGLCFESLVTPSKEPGHTLRVLVALKRILHPSVCGTAIYKEVIFAETIDLFVRVVLTGDAKELLAIVSIAHNLSMNRRGRTQISESPNSGLEEDPEVVDDCVEQLFELFRIVILTLTRVLPEISESDDNTTTAAGVFKLEDPSTIALVRACLDYLVDMISVFPTIIKTDLYACLLYVFGKMLEDDRCQKSIVPHCLHVEKKLFQMMMETGQKSVETASVINDEVSMALAQGISLLQHTQIDEEIGVLKRKNCILWIVVMITTCARVIPSDSRYITDLCQILLDNIRVAPLSTIVAECIKTLLVSNGDTSLGSATVEKLVPSLALLSVVHKEEEGDERTPEERVAASTVPILVINTLMAFVLSLKDDEKVSAGLGLVLPTLLYFLNNDYMGIDREKRLKYVNSQVLKCALAYPDAFKSVVQSGLNAVQKETLEKVVQAGGAAETVQPSQSQGQSQNHIELKSFGA